MSKDILLKEAHDSFRFLMDHTNFDESSTGYGLTLDRSSNKIMSSVAARWFMLTSLVWGATRAGLTMMKQKKSILISKELL